MKIWVMYYHDYEGSFAMGFYSSKELANEALANRIKLHPNDEPNLDLSEETLDSEYLNG